MKSYFSRIRWDRFFAFPWHSLLLALYAPLGLGAHNIGQIPFGYIPRAVILSGIFALILLLVCWLFLRNWQVAGIVATIILILFLSYGHVYNYLEGAEIGGLFIGRHRYLVAAWLVVAGLGIGWVIRKPQNYASLTSTLNLMALVLLAMPVAGLLFYEARSTTAQPTEPSGAQETKILYQVGKPDTGPLRDVYYIILDAYGRSDILLDLFGYDNSAFLGRLEKLGFYVVDCAQSNYSKTDLSLSSSLNMQYVTALDSTLTPDNTDRVPLWNLIKDNQVKLLFQELGYRVLAFETGFDFTHLNHVDVLYSPERKGFNEFEILYVRTTLARLLDDAGLLERFEYKPEDRKRELILFDLETLQEIPSTPGPKFVFAHLVIPHQPFVFGPNGESFVIPEKVHKGNTYYTNRDYALGYANQVAFISDRIANVVESILENSTVPPIIILQGDHGPSHFDETSRMAILNAYYFPDHESTVYPEITPVNSFRLLFNNYFNTGFDLLENVSYYSEYPNAYQFEVIPNQCQNGGR
jgi:hypothetical protein